jgi:hypothetical protein
VTPSGKQAKEPEGPGRYEPLTRYLKGLDAGPVTLTFDQLYDILGFRLPAAASNHAQWWQASGTQPQARGWKDAGWSFVRTDRRDQSVTFRKDAPKSKSGASPAARAATRAPAAKKRAPAKTAFGGAARAARKSLASSLILLPDSVSKRRGGDPAWRRQVTALALLGDAGAGLGDARRALAELVGEAAGPDLGGDGLRRAYLPALERYDGELYEAAQLSALSAEDRETLRRSCLIVSGLYGLLAPVEPIRDHAVTMDTELPDGRPVGQWWREHGLGEVLRAYITQVGATDVYCFLPDGHIEAVGGLESVAATVHLLAGEQTSDALAEQGRALARLLKEGR